MAGWLIRVADPVVEEVAGASAADVDTIVSCKTEINDLCAAVVERRSPFPSDPSELLIA
jgi:uncharacterized alkaline shock family protein YloU